MMNDRLLPDQPDLPLDPAGLVGVNLAPRETKALVGIVIRSQVPLQNLLCTSNQLHDEIPATKVRNTSATQFIPISEVYCCRSNNLHYCVSVDLLSRYLNLLESGGVAVSTIKNHLILTRFVHSFVFISVSLVLLNSRLSYYLSHIISKIQVPTILGSGSILADRTRLKISSD